MDINENLLGLFDSPNTGSQGGPKPPNTGLDTLNEDLYGAFNSAPTPPKAEPPKAPPRASTAPTTPDLGKAPKWADIEAKPEYQALSPEEKAGAKARYFDYWVAPNAGSDAASLRERFLAPPKPAAAPAPKPAAAPAPKPEEPGMFQRALDTVVGGIANLIEPGTGYLPNEQIPSAMRKVLEAQYRAAPNDIKIEMSTDPGMSAPLEKRALASIAREMNQRSGLKLPEVGTPVEEQNPITGTARNLTAGVLKIGPTAVKGVTDIAQMATGGNVGKDTSDAMKRGMESIDELIGTKQFNEQQRGFAKVLQDDTKGVGDMFSYLLDNPSVLVDESITTIGSMFLPAGAAKGAAMVASARGLSQAATIKAALATSVATIAAQNAADTFTSLEDQPLANRYQAAATSAAISVLASIATGGGAEGAIARRLAGDLSAGRIGLERVKSFLSAVFKEGAQEAGEEVGNIAGEAVGRRELPSAPNAAKRTAFAGTLGGIMGGGVNLVLGEGPQGQAAPPNAPNQERIEPTIGPIPGVEPPAEPPQTEAAPTSPTAPTPPPAAAEPVSEDDRALLDYAETRLDELLSKAEGGFRTIFTDQGEIEQELPPTPLTERERQEVAALQEANGDLNKLRQLFGAQPNPQTTEEPVDGTQATETEQAAPQGQEPGSPAAEVTPQAQDPIDGLGALFGGEQAGAATDKEDLTAAPKTEREAKRQRDVEDLIAQVKSATSLEELSRISQDANARFPEADVMGEGEPNDDDRAMATVSQAAAQRARQITESGEVAATKPKTEREMLDQRRKTTVIAGNEKLDAEWAVVDADEVKASMKEGVNQPRDRTRAASNIQVAEISRNPDFERLSDTSKTMDYGSPTLTSDGVIVGGNGRFEGVSLAYENNMAGEYRKQLEANAARFGLDPAAIRGMKKPVLVRRVTQDADTRRLAIQSNQAAGLQMSDMEQAAVDAERMTALDQIQVDDSGDIPMTANNIQAIKAALKGYTTNELAGLVAADGTIAQSGKRRIRNAILYKAYGKSETLARLIESPNADLKNVGTALVRAAAQLAQARTVDGYDISQDITEAVETLSQLRAEGRSIEDFLSQIGMFGDTISAEAKEILQFMNDNIRSARAITEYLQEYAAIVQSVENAGDGLFGAMELPTKLDTLRNLRGKNDAANRQGEAQGDLLGAGNQPPADGAGETGTPDREQPQGEGGDARGSQADEGEAGGQEQVSQPAAEPTALEAWGAKAAAVTKLRERVERLLGNFKQKGWKIPAGGADVLKKELTTNARFAFQEFLDNTPGTSGKSLDARLASFNKALEGMYQEAFRKLVELNPELYAAGNAQSVVNAKEVVDRALANFNAVPNALLEINTLFLMAREYLTGEREALPPKDEKKDKLQNVGEKLWGSRKDLAKKKLGEGKTGDLDKDIQKVLDSASKTRVWNIVQPEGASTGTVVFLTEVRNRFPSLLEYVGSNAGGGRGRYEESFSEATKRKAKDEGIDFLIEEAADYIATMEQMREATRNAMSIAEAKAALDKLIGTIEYKRDDRGLSRPKTNLTEFGEIATKYARLIVSDLNDYARRTKEDSSISKGVDRRPPLENIVRENLPDRRNGKDVNGDDFIQAFGFRGVEFGEWVNAAERQANINHAYDALWDLADALNMPAKAISFGGRMGLAFGSRGRGGRAAAHYEPNTNVINLTKTKGDGTVAHEWGHALDHFLTGEMQGFKAGTTANASSKKAVNSLKKALQEKYDIEYAVKTLDRLLSGQSHLRNNKRLGPIETARAYVENKYWKLEGWNIRRATNFKNEADRLGKDYWGTPVEMWARAFEAFVFDELGTRKSPYLVTGWVGDGATSMDTGYKGNPYASDVERAGFNDLFRDLVKNIEWSDEGPKVKDDYVSPTEGRATEVDQAVREAFQKRLDGEKKNDGLYWYQLSDAKSKGQPGQPSAVSASGKLVGYPFPLAVEELKEFGMTVAAASWQPGEGTIYAKPPAQEEPTAAEPDIDLGNMFDDLMREELAKGKPKTEREMRERQGQSERSPITSIQSAGKNTAEGLGNAIDGLGKLFGGNGKLNSGFTFDEETYAKAKPLFIAAAKNFVQAGQDIKEAMRAIIRMVLDKFGQVAVENMKPYIVRFISDVQAGKIEFDTEPQEAAPTLESPEGRHEIARQLFVMLAGGQSFATINDARAKIAEITGTPIKSGTEAAKLADETVEAAVVMAGREIVAAGRRLKLSSADIYDRLVALYNRQPNLGVRSSTSVREQAYSTPVPLAFLASELAGITAQTRVLEPTAGNGMLLIGANPASVQANELNANRAAALRQMGFNVTTENAATTQFGARVDAVIANPPFGAVKDADGNTITFTVTPDYTTNEIDHAIAFNALKAMKDDGTAVLIVGGSMAKENEARRKDYRGAAKRAFYYNLYNSYNVTGHFTVAGSLYSKQGASFPVDVIVIQGRGANPLGRDLPAAELPVVIESFEQLKEILNGIGSVGAEGDLGSDRTAGGEGADGQRDRAGVGGETGRPGDGDGQQGTPGGDGRGMSGSGRAGDGRSGRGGSVSRDGQSQSENAPNTGDGQQSVSGEGNAKRGSRAGDQGDRSGDVGRSGGLDGQRLESGLTDRRGQEQETGSQVAYTPRSEAASVGTLVPAAMRDSIQESLQRIEDNVGSLDEYVAKALEMDLETARANFSAEQIDALALGIYNAEQGKGFIIGDQTGIGKGRVVAGMIRYALRKGRIPIFVTEKPNLYSDMIRDLDDIGMDEELGLTGEKPRIFMTNSDATVPYSIVRMKGEDITETNLNLKPAKRGEQLAKMMKDMIAANTLGDYRVIFTTYSQLQTVKGQPTERQRFVQHFGRDNFMIFDESHNAGGSGETQARTKGQRDAQKEGGSLATGRAAFVRGLVTNAFGTFFSSATYAKRPDVMDLYASTNMKLAVNKISELAEAIKRGGVPMQQIVATMLTQDGQYIRRERTFAGVSYDTQETVVDKETAENMANAMRSVLSFSRMKEAAVKAMQKELDKEGKMMGVTGEKTTVQGANFGSIMHNLIDQMLLSLKVQDSLRHAIERLKAGEKVVMTVSNTMGSFLKDYAEEMELNVGDPVSLSFADLYIRYLEKQRIVTIKAPNGQKTKYRLTDKDLGPTLTARYNAILEQIRGSGFGSAPISPIDFMHAELRKAGYKTDEITGRTIALNYSSGAPKLSSRSSDIKQRVNAVRSFNNGAVDVLILNQAGSTGLSLHASSKVKDQRKRHMIIVQPEKNIDTHMQMLGRVHRTGQVVAPAYSQMMADIPAEQRPAAVLLKKMASLNANTTASRKSAVTAEGVVDFMNDYGGQVVQEFLRDNPEIHLSIGGNKIVTLVDDPAEDANEDDIRKFTGYVPILPIKQQEAIYEELIARYNDLIERENSLGTNKLEAKAVDLDAETLSVTPITDAKEENSVFAREANMEQVDVKRTVKPFTSEEVRALVMKRLEDSGMDGANLPAQISRAQITNLRKDGQAFIDANDKRLEDAEADPVRRQQQKDNLGAILNHAMTVLDTYQIGNSIQVKNKDGVLLYGVITDIMSSGRTQNPAAGSNWKMQVALANGDAKSLTLSFSQIGSAYELQNVSRINYFNTDTGKAEYGTVYDVFDKGSTTRREKRWIVTGNILAGYANWRGQIIQYTKKDGTTGQGVLMNRQFDFEKEQKEAPVRINTTDNAIRFLTEIGRNAAITSTDGNFRIINKGNGYYSIVVPSSKKTGGYYFLDQNITKVTGDFFKSGAQMSVQFGDSNDRLRKVLDVVLAKDDVTLTVQNYLDQARKLLAPKSAAVENISRGPAKRTAELQEAAKKLKAGEISKAEYEALVNKYRPVTPYAESPRPASDADMRRALSSDKIGRINAASQLEDGAPVGLRLDIPAFTRHGVWVVSVHNQRKDFAAGKSIGYASTAVATGVTMGMVEDAALNIAAGGPKGTIAVMKGNWKNATPEQAKAMADAAIKDPAWRQIGIDPERHSYFYDRTTMEPIVAAEEIIQVGPLVLGKNVQYAERSNFLFTISRSPAGAFAEVAPKVRADGLRRLEKAQARLDEGKITDAEFQLAVKEVIASMRDQRDERAYRDVMSARRRGGDWIKSRMRKAVSDGVIPAKEADFAEWLIDQNPAVAEQLGISVRTTAANGTAAASYNPAEKVFTLFKGETEGDSAVHEILHHAERMMPVDVQIGIRKEWEKQWLAAFRAASPERKKAMADMLKASMGDAAAKQRVVQAFQNRVLEFGTDYALYSPSEFWAVNGTRIMDDRFMADQSWVKRAIQWLKEFIERAKGAFGLRSDAPVIKGLKAVIKGDGKFVPGMQLLKDGPDSEAIAQEIAGANLDAASAAASERPTSVENMRRVRNNIVQFWANRRGTIKNFNAYDKSLATQYHKALKDGDFGKVFALTNAILNAVSLTSIRAAEMAPGILPKAEDVRSAFATAFGPGQSQRDIKAAADAIFAGTLAGDTVMDGTVWTEAEFMAREGASQAAWALYQQARAAIDASIDELAAAEAYAVVQDMMPREARRQILDDVSRARPTIFGAIDRRLRVLNQTLSQAMLAQNDAAQEEIKAEIKSLEDTREKVLKVFGIAKRLKEAGYAPLMRFGKFAVTVTRIDPVTGLPDRGDDGDSTLFFGRYESESEAKAMRAELERQYAGQSDIEITAAPVSEKSHEMYSGISPETIAIFAETIGAEAAMKTYIENVMSERSALKRRLERKGTPGYSRELPRVLSNFITSNARYASQRYFMKELDRAISRISKKEKGDVRDEAIKLKQFVMNPSDGGAEISSLMFTWFLTGSVAAAAVNTTQTVTTTVPYLSQFASTRDASKAFGKAMKVSLGRAEPDPDLRAALKRASQEGIVDAQEIFHLYSVGAQGVATRLGNIVGAGEQARVRMNGFLTLLGSMFSLAEKFNRKVAFVAAYEIARESGGQNPYAFAVRAVNETQGIYSKANRPNWARNPAGRVILTFKQFSIMYMEMFARMVKKGGPEGKRAALFMLGILMLLAGEEGLPFAQDLNDLIDTLGQMLGFDTNMVRAKRRAAYEIFGEQLGDFMLYGLSSMLPMDWHGRLGLGNLIPGTGLLKPSNENMRTREFAEILGPSAGAATQIADAIDAGFEGKGGKAVQNALPKFAKDIATAAEWGAKGYATDTRGRKITEVDGLDVASKAIGFQPTAVARQQRKVGPVYQDIALQKRVESSIVDKWARGVLDGDQAAIAEASAKLDSWNAKNTDTPIVITPNQIRDRARGMAAERDGRMIKQAPREMRERVRQGLEEASPAQSAPTTKSTPARPSVGLDSAPAGRQPPTEAGVGTALARLVAEEGAAHLLPVIKAIRDQESSGGRDTRTSTDGAQGSMQLIPSTFRAYAKPGERIDNPADNIRVGARYIKDLADKFGNDPAKIAVGYFSGEGNVNRGQGEPWKRDFRDGNGKRVSSYANDIEARVKGREPS